MSQVLWGVKKGDEDWEEQVIVETDDPAVVTKAQAWASEKGFDRFRVSVFNYGDVPDFTNVLNIQKGGV